MCSSDFSRVGLLLAYLLAEAELSLESVLVTDKIMGRRKTVVYIGLVMVFSALAWRGA